MNLLLADEPAIYGGTQMDLYCLHILPDPKTGERPKETNNMELLCLIDTPLTGVVETVALPYLIYRNQNPSPKTENKPEQDPATQ